MATTQRVLRTVILPFNNDVIDQYMTAIRTFVSQHSLAFFLTISNDSLNYKLEVVLTQADDATALAWLTTPANYQGLGLSAPPPTWSVTVGYA